MIACERVFNLHAWPAKREVEVASRGSLCPLKWTIYDGYQMQFATVQPSPWTTL